MEHFNEKCHESYGLKLGFKITKLILKFAMVGIACRGVKELHKIHKAIKHQNEK